MADWRRLARLGSLAFLAAALSVSAASAQGAIAASAFDELLERLPRGAFIAIDDDDGNHFRGRLSELSAESLAIDVNTDGVTLPYRFTRDQVLRVAATDSTGDGFWRGFAVGAVPGVLLATAFHRLCVNESSSRNGCARAFPILGGVTGLVGGLIGAGVDGAINGPVYYSRPTSARRATVQPMAMPGLRGGGLLVSVGF